MSDGQEDFGATVARAIEVTLDKESRKNEQTIAAVRVTAMVALLAIEAWLLIGGSILGAAAVPLAALSLVYTGVSAAIWVALSRGWWSRHLKFVAPTLDALFYSVRQGVTLYLVGIEGFIGDQDLATVMGFACLLILSSALRLTGTAVLYAAALGTVVYVGFALAIELDRFFISLQLIFVLATVLATYGLAPQVGRAVQGEVRRLTVARLLPAAVLAQADEDPVALVSKPRSLEATVVITDIRGFTAWSEHRTPLEVLAFLNRVQGGLAEIVHEHNGTVDKFMGDGMLAVFGAPVAHEGHAQHALDAVDAMLAFIEGVQGVRLGVGVHTGELVVGCLGSGVRMEFTILGDTVNTASRLESKTKELGVDVVISDATARAVSRPLAPLAEIAIRGRDQRMEVFTLPGQSPS